MRRAELVTFTAFPKCEPRQSFPLSGRVPPHRRSYGRTGPSTKRTRSTSSSTCKVAFWLITACQGSANNGSKLTVCGNRTATIQSYIVQLRIVTPLGLARKPSIHVQHVCGQALRDSKPTAFVSFLRGQEYLLFEDPALL